MTAKHSPIVAAALLVAASLCAPPARAAENASPGMLERDFMNDAASGGMMEVELGRYAASHAASDRVKQFGQRMVDDHGKANAELKQVAAQKSVVLPATMNDEHREMVSHLMRLQGPEFDRAYMSAMVEDHEKDVATFREKARSTQDPALKAFAAKTLPTLEEHLQMAKDISARTGAATSGVKPHGD